MSPWERLVQLLDLEQFELVEFDKVTPMEDGTDCKLIYLMNDCAESFLVFKNVRYTGQYIENYEGKIEYSLDQSEGFLRVNQGESHLLLFFDGLELENHFYNYGQIGHFWVKGYENLRNLEFQIAIISDKYQYLGAESCNERECKIASLREFPPLGFLCYPAVSKKYWTSVEKNWIPSKEAISVFSKLCEEVGDRKMGNLLEIYGARPSAYMAKKIARRLAKNQHSKVVDRLYEWICQASGDYPMRSFGQERDGEIKKKWDQAIAICETYKTQGIMARAYREEPFVYECDDITWKVYVMLLKRGIRNRRIKLLEI